MSLFMFRKEPHTVFLLEVEVAIVQYYLYLVFKEFVIKLVLSFLKVGHWFT